MLMSLHSQQDVQRDHRELSLQAGLKIKLTMRLLARWLLARPSLLEPLSHA